MKSPHARLLCVGILIAFGAACGKKGPPLAPLRPVPSAVSGVSIERSGELVTLQFTVPDSNTDGSTPPAVQGVEIYGLTLAADAAPPAPSQLLLAAHLVTSVRIRPPEEPQPGAPPDGRPAAGEVARYAETVVAPGADAAASRIRYYAVVPVAGRRRGPLSAIHRVPLTAAPAAPGELKADYTETTLTLVWEPPAGVQTFIVDETDSAGANAKRASSAPIKSASHELPVQFGATRCFVVRAVNQRDVVSVLGAPSAPVCITMVDRFAPPAPEGLLAVPIDGGVELVWNAASAPDLAGYVVLRRDDPNGTLQRLTPEPITAVTYRDLTTRAGLSYEYAVVAIDKAANESGPSNRQTVTARQPAGR